MHSMKYRGKAVIQLATFEVIAVFVLEVLDLPKPYMSTQSCREYTTPSPPVLLSAAPLFVAPALHTLP